MMNDFRLCKLKLGNINLPDYQLASDFGERSAKWHEDGTMAFHPTLIKLFENLLGRPTQGRLVHCQLATDLAQRPGAERWLTWGSRTAACRMMVSVGRA